MPTPREIELARRAETRGLEQVSSGVTPGTEYYRSETAGRELSTAVTTPAPADRTLPTPSPVPTAMDRAKLSSPQTLMQAVKDRLASDRERNLAPLQERRGKLAEDLTTLGTRSLGKTQGFDISAVRESENIQRQVLRSQISELDRRIDDRQRTIDQNIQGLVGGQVEVNQALIAQQKMDFDNRQTLRQLEMKEDQLAFERQTTLASIAASLPQGTKLSQLGFTGAEGEIEGVVAPKVSGGGISYISSGGGAISPMPGQPEMSFEEYLAEKENEAGMSFGQDKRDEIREEYDAFIAQQKAITGALDPTDITNQFNKKVVNLAKNQREFAQQQFNQFMQSGDVEGAKDFLDGIGQPLNQTTIASLTDTVSAIPSLNRLESAMSNLLNKFGPVQGIISKYNKFDVDAQTAQAQIDLVKQLVGKGLEGGVLRKEDEAKYKRILSQLDDDPQVAMNKIPIIIKELESKLNIQLDMLSGGGFNVQGVRQATDSIIQSVPMASQQTVSVEDLARQRGFDYAAAKVAGATDEEIRQFLTQ